MPANSSQLQQSFNSHKEIPIIHEEKSEESDKEESHQDNEAEPCNEFASLKGSIENEPNVEHAIADDN